MQGTCEVPACASEAGPHLERSTSTCPLVSLLRPSSTVERLRRNTPLLPDSAPIASAAAPRASAQSGSRSAARAHSTCAAAKQPRPMMHSQPTTQGARNVTQGRQATRQCSCGEGGTVLAVKLR
jgi:hypothetical protein